MNKDNREWLSALSDGELQGKELEKALDALQKDPELLSSWKAYHVIRDSVSSNLDGSMDFQLHDRISSAIENEPTVLAPQRRKRPWLKQVAGLAIAASVTGVAIIGVQTLNGEGSVPTAVPVAQQQEYIRLEPTLVAGAEDKPKAEQADALNPYLVNHNEFSTSSGMQGVLPYVRIVGHQEGK
jgi:sigma-E factor negative regulatory protein RseA